MILFHGTAERFAPYHGGQTVVSRAIMRDHKVSSELYEEAVKHFGRKGLVELVTVMGDYVMVGMVMTAIDQQVPADRPELLPKR